MIFRGTPVKPDYERMFTRTNVLYQNSIEITRNETKLSKKNTDDEYDEKHIKLNIDLLNEICFITAL
jgi:hypothetical protein